MTPMKNTQKEEYSEEESKHDATPKSGVRKGPDRVLTPEQHTEFSAACKGLDERRTVTSWGREGRGITAMVKRNIAASEILACYDHFANSRQWVERTLSMVWVNENIESWQKANGRSRGGSNGQRDAHADAVSRELQRTLG